MLRNACHIDVYTTYIIQSEGSRYPRVGFLLEQLDIYWEGVFNGWNNCFSLNGF